MIGALDAAAAHHGIALDTTVRGRLGQWMVLLAHHNQRANLTGPLDAPRFADELVVDSLHALPFVPDGARVVDIGSGAGLPGTPIALARRDVHMTWVEPRSKRALFLGTASRELGIGGTVIEGRVEALDPDARFDVAVSRAVFAPSEWLAVAAGLLAPGGNALVWCNGTPDDARAELDVPAELTPVGEAANTLADGRPRCVLAFRRG